MGFEEGSHFKADNWNVDDLSQPWVSDPEEDDLTSVAFASERSLDVCKSPDSLGSRTSCEAEEFIPVVPVVVSPYLKSLMDRYPKHIPASIPRMRKRRRPLCLFVNFMGTRRNKTTLASQPVGTKRGVAIVSPFHPRGTTAIISASPTKQQKVVDSHQNASKDIARSVIAT